MAIDFSKRYLVLGVGVTGASVARYLLDHQACVRVADSRVSHPSVLALANTCSELDIRVGEFSDALLVDIDILVVNPGLALSLPIVISAQAMGIEVVGDIELFARAVSCPVVAVTGTNGKSTVVSMVQAMGEQSAKTVHCGGNIGEPALNLLSTDADAIVLELSSYQLETTKSLRPEAACILNISEDHMDRYQGMADYAAAKHVVYDNCALAVWLKEDAQTQPADSGLDAVAVTAREPQDGEVGVRNGWLCEGEQPLFQLSSLGAPGRHNEINACFGAVYYALNSISNRFKYIFAKRNIEYKCAQ